MAKLLRRDVAEYSARSRPKVTSRILHRAGLLSDATFDYSLLSRPDDDDDDDVGRVESGERYPSVKY